MFLLQVSWTFDANSLIPLSKSLPTTMADNYEATTSAEPHDILTTVNDPTEIEPLSTTTYNRTPIVPTIQSKYQHLRMSHLRTPLRPLLRTPHRPLLRTPLRSLLRTPSGPSLGPPSGSSLGQMNERYTSNAHHVDNDNEFKDIDPMAFYINTW